MDTVSPLPAKSIGGKGSNRYIGIGSWNVEGLTSMKTAEVCAYMVQHGIDIFCIQETWKPNSDYYWTDDRFLVILSGQSTVDREWAGVGFIVSSKFASRIQKFHQVNERIASLTFRVQGGVHQLFVLMRPII